MEAVTILRELWRRRRLVAGVAAFSILCGLAVVYKVGVPPESRKFDVGIATGRILVDTPDSQVVDVQPKGSGTLGIRAGVLANVMTEGDVKAAIARRAGLKPNDLRAGVKVDGELPGPLASAGDKPSAHVLVTSPATTSDGTPLPMIDVEAQAPGPDAAARLADAAVSGLNDYLDSKAAGEDVPDAKRLQVTGFGAPEVLAESRGPSRLVALALTLFLFLLGCTAILVIFPLVRAWRDAAKADAAAADEPLAVHDQQPDPEPGPAERLVWPTRLVGRLKPPPNSRAVARVAAEHEHDSNGNGNGNGKEPSRNGRVETAESGSTV